MLETSLFVATLATLGMLSPGPDFFLIIRNAARYQRSAAMMTSLGVILGVATHMAYCVAGLAVLITTTPWLFNALKYTGAVYLIWIGIQALRSRG
ncbi:LysE family transporter, partial [Pseudomonas sp. L01]|nr:LysE family transporter [Pseudomonas sp. L01]